MEQRIQELEARQQQMEQEMASFKGIISSMIQLNQNLVGQVDGLKGEISELAQYIGMKNAVLENMKYELLDGSKQKDAIFYPQFRSNEETIRLIVEEKKSLARFGDGEFSIAFGIERQQFQRVDAKLGQRIWDVINAPSDNLLIGIANNYGCLEQYNEQGAMGIRYYMREETRKMHEQILPKDKIYTDAYVTRPYVIFKDNMTDAPKHRFERLKTIWEGKRIAIVEGAQTRLGVGNDLFAGTKEIKRIVAPATSSFDRYDDILDAAVKLGSEIDLFLLAIGPSAGVLAYDLSEQGYQAVDVGHIDLEYEWFLAGKGCRVPIPHKYNNEMPDGDIVEMIQDDVYDSQIVASFAD